MQEYIQAFIEFMTRIFSALATFLGWTIDAEELSTTAAEATTAGQGE